MLVRGKSSLKECHYLLFLAPLSLLWIERTMWNELRHILVNNVLNNLE